MIHPVYERVAELFRRRSVWQIVPPSGYRDRLATAGAPELPAGGLEVTDHGGSVIANPKLAIVYLGAWWGDTQALEQFAADLMNCGYLDSCAIYGVTGTPRYLGSWQGPALTGPTVTDEQLQAVVAALPAYGLPPGDGETIFALILPDGVSVVDGGNTSCAAFCGYHDAMGDGRTFYSVHPSTNCPGCNQGDAFAAFTMVFAHEVAEVATDAIPGQGWFNDETGMEISDECAWLPVQYGPWTVQPYQVNGVGCSFGASRCGAPPPPQGQPDINTAITAIQTAQAALVQALSALSG